MGFRKFLIFIFLIFVISCSKKEISPSIKEIIYDKDNIIIKLYKNENKTGKITEVFIGNNGGLNILNDISTEETNEELIISVNIADKSEEYILNQSYPFEIKWLGGWIKGNCIYKDKSFIIENEKYFNKSAF